MQYIIVSNKRTEIIEANTFNSAVFNFERDFIKEGEFILSVNPKNGYNNAELRSMLEDVVTEIGLSGSIIEKHGPLGTPPAELVRLVLDQKDRQISMLKVGMKQLNHKP